MDQIPEFQELILPAFDAAYAAGQLELANRDLVAYKGPYATVGDLVTSLSPEQKQILAGLSSVNAQLLAEEYHRKMEAHAAGYRSGYNGTGFMDLFARIFEANSGLTPASTVALAEVFHPMGWNAEQATQERYYKSLMDLVR